MSKYNILKPYGIIYLITNSINKKKYVGLTTRGVNKRFKEHCLEEVSSWLSTLNG